MTRNNKPKFDLDAVTTEELITLFQALGGIRPLARKYRIPRKLIVDRLMDFSPHHPQQA